MVCDAGRGMTPRPDSPGAGLGLPLVASIAQRFDVQARSGGGTRLCMYFQAACWRAARHSRPPPRSAQSRGAGRKFRALENSHYVA